MADRKFNITYLWVKCS